MDSFSMMLAQAGAQGTTPAQQGPPMIMQLVPIILLFVVFYLFLIRPQQKQRKEHQQMLTQLTTGDKIVTSGGIHGVIANVKEKTFVVRIADGVKIEIDKSSVGRVAERGTGEAVADKK